MAAPRRILLATNSYTFGGVESHVALLGRELLARGFEPVVLSADREELRTLMEQLRGDGVPHLALDFISGGAARQLDATRRLVNLLRQARPDVLHLHLIGHGGGRVPLLAARLCRLPTIVTHHVAPAHRLHRLERLSRVLALSGVSTIVAVSDANRSGQIANIGIAPSRIRRIHNGIEMTEALPKAAARRQLRALLGVPDAARVVGMVGRLAEQKGHRHLLDCAAAIVEQVPEVQFAFVGDGELRAELTEQAQRRGVLEHLHFLGFRDDVRLLLPGLDVMAMPSDFEGLPIALLEGMACEVPVVAYAVDGIPEAIDDRQNGILVRYGDVEDLGRRITQLLLDPAYAAQLGQRARHTVESRFVSSLMIDRLIAEYARAHQKRRMLS